MGYGLTLVTAPTDEPLAPIEVIQHLRLPADTDEDDLLAGLVAAARDQAEARTNRALVTQTWRLTLDAFPDCEGAIVLPKPPLQSITSITYVDLNGTTQTLAPAAYQVDTSRLLARVAPAYGTYWPPTREQMNAVAVTFACGYGDAAAVPAGIKAAMKLLIGNWYENREATISGTIIAEVPFTVDALFGPYRVLVPH